MSGIDRRTLLAAGAAAAALPAVASSAEPSTRSLAPTPPMGWNSWNSFASTITEAQAIETAGIMVAKLLPAGYDIFTVDIQWYDPNAKSYEYTAKPVPAMDGNGRLLPAPSRFPSSAGGAGFAPRSPLIMGGDLRHLDAATLTLLTNPEVIAVNEASTDNRPHILEDGARVWSATAPGGRHYVALFNTSDKPRSVGLPLDRLGIHGRVAVRDLWSRAPLADMRGVVAQALPSCGSGVWRVSAIN